MPRKLSTAAASNLSGARCASIALVLLAAGVVGCTEGKQSATAQPRAGAMSSPGRATALTVATPSFESDSVLHSFARYPNGGNPMANLVQVGGKLIGTTQGGGAHDLGTVFQLSADASGAYTVLTVLHSFTCQDDGCNPAASLIQVGDKLIGTTQTGGATGWGTVFQLAADQNGAYTVLTTLHAFDRVADGAVPLAGLVLVGDKLYGTTYEGGPNDHGTVFQLSADQNGAYTVFTLLYSFTGGSDCGSPETPLVAMGGKLYGTTSWCDASYGTVFELAADENGAYTVHSTLHAFSGPDGAAPYGSLVSAGDKLYGTTTLGGAGMTWGTLGFGTIFQLSADASGVYNQFASVHSFDGNDGNWPSGNLLLVGEKLYGMTQGGGAFGVGIVFQVALDGSGITTVHSFNGTDGANPSVIGLVQVDGKLYGATTFGGSFGGPGAGTVFQLAADDTGEYTVLTTMYSFPSAGAYPLASLVQVDDKLYGTTAGGGAGGWGVVFQLAADESGAYTRVTTLHSFDSTDGSAPYASLVQVGETLYGTTTEGGSSSAGTVFALSKDASGAYTVFSPLHVFSGNADGGSPMGKLLQLGGNLYGTTRRGGEDGYDAGTVFQLSKDGNGAFTQLTTLHVFHYDDGGMPFAGLVALDGKLYGTTSASAGGYGTVFQLAPDANGAYTVLTTLHSFTGLDGALPYADLVALDGKLYGTTAGLVALGEDYVPSGGSSDNGTVFQLAPDANGAYTVLTTLHSFDGTDGSMPTGSLLPAGGTLYGTTSAGGTYGGTVFELSTDGNGDYTVLTTLHSFNDADGSGPSAGLIQASDGNLYGATRSGGSAREGTVFYLYSWYPLTATLAGDGSGTIVADKPTIACDGTSSGSTCNGDYKSGSSVTLTATPSAGSTFAGWSNGGCTGTGPCTVAMTAAKSITATFTLARYALSVTLQGTGTGTVTAPPPGLVCTATTAGTTCTGSFAAGASVTLTEAPASGSTFAGWSGACSGQGKTCTVTMTTDLKAAATFNPAMYVVTVDRTGTGTITSSPAGITCGTSCSMSVPNGTKVTLGESADSGWVFGGWSGPCSGTKSTCSFTVNADTKVGAVFNPILTVKLSGSGKGTVSVTPPGATCSSKTCTYVEAAGTKETLTAIPAGGYRFAGWSGACTGNGPCIVLMNRPQSVTATFTR